MLLIAEGLIVCRVILENKLYNFLLTYAFIITPFIIVR